MSRISIDTPLKIKQIYSVCCSGIFMKRSSKNSLKNGEIGHDQDNAVTRPSHRMGKFRSC